MALQQLVEPVNGGLVTSRDPTTLQPGELTSAVGYYRPCSQALWHVPAAGVFDQSGVLTTPPTGLAFCSFDLVTVVSQTVQNQVTVNAATGQTFNGVSAGSKVIGRVLPSGVTVASKPSSTQIVLSAAPTETNQVPLQFEADNLLIAQQNSQYWSAKAGASGTPASVETIKEGRTLDAVHFTNSHILLNGSNDNRVVKADGTFRAHGMQPVITAPALTTGVGTWGLDSGTGYYAYWTTEYDTVNGIESDFQGKPAVVNVSTLATKVTITRPARVNSSATLWRVYRSPKITATTQEIAEKTAVLTGSKIAELELKDDGTLSSVDDGGGTTSIVSAAGATTDGTVGKVQKGTNSAITLTWASTASAHGNTDAAYATLTYDSVNSLGARNLIFEVGGFGLASGSITPPITGITVTVQGKKTNNGQLAVQVYSSDLINMFLPETMPAKYIPLTTSNAAYTVGSSTDIWFKAGYPNWWTPGMFADGKFFVRLLGTVQATGDVVSVDSVQVAVYYGKAQQVGTFEEFPTITVSPFGDDITVGQNGPPPKATTGDVFQNSLVLNDVTSENRLWYSFPGKLDAFPSLYYIDFQTRDQDRITNIKTIGNMLIVGLSTQIWRSPYLPQAEDAEFDRGRAIELVEGSHGIAGPKAATVITLNGQQVLAYVARTSTNTFELRATEGYRTWLLTDDINGRNVIEPSEFDRTVLINYPDNSELLLLYAVKGSGSTGLNGMLRFSYHQSHLKNGMLKVSAGAMADQGGGPALLLAAEYGVLRDGSRYLYFSDSTGGSGIYYPLATAKGALASMSLETRRLPLAGIGNEFKLQSLSIRATNTAFSSSFADTIHGSFQVYCEKSQFTGSITSGSAGGAAYQKVSKSWTATTANTKFGGGKLYTAFLDPTAESVSVIAGQDLTDVNGDGFTVDYGIEYLVFEWEDEQAKDPS